MRRFVRFRPPRPDEDPAANRMRERLGGIFIAAIGIGFTIAMWNGRFPVQAALQFPTFAVLGLALIVIPGYRTERRMRGENVEALRGRALITRRWWIVIGLALLAAVVNLALLTFAGKADSF